MSEPTREDWAKHVHYMEPCAGCGDTWGHHAYYSPHGIPEGAPWQSGPACLGFKQAAELQEGAKP